MRNALRSKVVVITGASSGIGEAMATLYAKMGARVVLGARSGDKLAALTAQIVADGGEALCCVTDVTVAEDCPMRFPMRITVILVTHTPF